GKKTSSIVFHVFWRRWRRRCYYDELLPEKKHRLTPSRSFEVENKLEPELKSELARKLGVQPRQVAVWFQNRMALGWKTKQLEHDFDLLKSSYDSLLVDHQSLLKDNDRLSPPSDDIALLMELKADDCLSTKSAGSAVLGERTGQKLIDSSGDSYFPANYGNLGYSVGCVEENDCNFLHGALEHQQPDAGQIGWWDWS
ncbi:hypothetical protein J5N97_001688, partial [Dioscorea zingiberensis]